MHDTATTFQDASHDRRRLAIGALLLAACLARQPLAAAGADRQPNIVFIMADDLGHGALGCYGQQQLATPNIDRIANEGMRFTRAYAGSHVCQPSRSTLMTGLHTGHTACRANDVDQHLHPEDITIAELLKMKGYATGGFGKWGLGYEGTTGHPNRQGFDEFFGQYLQVHAHFYYPFWVWHNGEKFLLPENEGRNQVRYVADETHKMALDFIRRNRDGPFFAYLPYIIPHVELVVPEESERPFRGKFPQVAILDTRPGYLGSEDGYATLAGMIARLDGYVGDVLKLLDELGLADDTIVVFTSDNGAQSGGREAGWTKMTDYFRANGDLRGYKGSYYEGGLRVPFLVRWPGRVNPGTTSDHILAFWDVLPTLCDAVGIDKPADLDGISLLPTLTGSGEQDEHLGLYWEYPLPRDGGISRGARIGRWKAIQMRPGGPVELYDLEADPSEQQNVAAQHPAVVRETVAFMDGAHQPLRDYPHVGPATGVNDYVR
jgi:arylsulfatase A-like enzyme